MGLLKRGIYLGEAIWVGPRVSVTRTQKKNKNSSWPQIFIHSRRVIFPLGCMCVCVCDTRLPTTDTKGTHNFPDERKYFAPRDFMPHLCPLLYKLFFSLWRVCDFSGTIIIIMIICHTFSIFEFLILLLRINWLLSSTFEKFAFWIAVSPHRNIYIMYNFFFFSDFSRWELRIWQSPRDNR